MLQVYCTSMGYYDESAILYSCLLAFAVFTFPPGLIYPLDCHVFLLTLVFPRFLPFLVPFVTALFNGCLRPISHAEDGPWNWSETFVVTHYGLATH